MLPSLVSNLKLLCQYVTKTTSYSANKSARFCQTNLVVYYPTPLSSSSSAVWG